MIDFSYSRYVDDVLSGKQVACKWVRLACERHARDLETCEERGFWFDEDTAKKAIAFFYLLKHSKGEWAGMLIHLEPWEQFIIAMIFGWRRDDSDRWMETDLNGVVEDSRGTRRFRNAYLEVARKNGKTSIIAGTGLYLLLADGEPGAEIYSVATKKDQAGISHSEATRMAKSSPAISREVTIFRNNIHIVDTASKFEPLGSDSETQDGLNIHGVLADELHRWKTRDLWDVLETATGSRRQPLMIAITTAGYDRHSLCWQQHEFTQKVLEGVLEDDTWFGIIYTIDDNDRLDDESIWVKANPNLGVSKKWNDMRLLAARAKEMPSQLNAFQRLHLDIWTQSETKWISFEHWAACSGAVDPLGLRGRSCYGGLDLSSNIDISALLLVFPPAAESDPFNILCRFFIPEDAILERVRRDRVPYDVWVRQGYITATPGAVIDYDWILHQIDEDAKVFDIREIAFDRWGATKIQTDLMDRGGDDWLVQFGQGFASMAAPMKELERLILEHKLAHGNNPVLNWMANNLVVRMDPAGNLKPDKEKSIEKIDGMVALVMALDRALRHEPPKRSVYEDRGLSVV
jgi:phage terminase large subunit-like protein